MDETQDVGASTPDATGSQPEVDSSPTPMETSDVAGDVITSDVALSTPVEQSDDPLKDVPTLEELQAQAENKIPYAQALAQLRPAYEAAKARAEELASLESWKPVAEKYGDPSQVQADRELLDGLYAPVLDANQQPIPNQFTSRPFLERLEKESPGTVDQIFTDTLTFQVPDKTGKPSTVVRELVKSWGLDPDRIEDYRNIDQRASGVVTSDELQKIDPRYHSAFKSLSQAGREDILELLAAKEANPENNQQYGLRAEEHLRNAQEALEAKEWREKNEQANQQAQQRQQREFQGKVEQAVNDDISKVRQEVYDSIAQNLASQWKPSTDELTSELEYSKVMGTLESLLDPTNRTAALRALKAAGVTLDPSFDETVNRFADRRSAYKQFEMMGDQRQASRALSEAKLAKDQLLIKLNVYALKLAKPTGDRLHAQSVQLGNQLAGATARTVPNGQGVVQQNGNPFQRPAHIQPFTPEYEKWMRDVGASLSQ